jgi:hypothetical protein
VATRNVSAAKETEQTNANVRLASKNEKRLSMDWFGQG